MIHTTRESWLQDAASRLNTLIDAAGTTPAVNVRVSCGWPARGALAKVKRRVGECWPGEHNTDHRGHVFVSPCVDKPLEVLAILLHELIHAALPAKAKHGKGFAKVCAKVGLEGKPTSTVAGAALATRLHADIIPSLGDYPHVAIDATVLKKQSTRMRLYECQCVPTPVTVRTASDSLDATCNTCAALFVLQSGHDDEGGV